MQDETKGEANSGAIVRIVKGLTASFYSVLLASLGSREYVADEIEGDRTL